VYAIFPYWPGKQAVLKEFAAGAGTKVTMLGVDRPLKFKAEGGNLVVDLEGIDPAKLPFEHAYTIRMTDVK
jgi:hypothetical protein